MSFSKPTSQKSSTIMSQVMSLAWQHRSELHMRESAGERSITTALYGLYIFIITARPLRTGVLVYNWIKGHNDGNA
jgi:hypothetical protein